MLGINIIFIGALRTKLQKCSCRKSSVLIKQKFSRYIVLGVSCLNKFDAATKGTKQFSNPQAFSSTLASLRTLHPHTLWLLNHLVSLVLASNYYVVAPTHILIFSCLQHLIGFTMVGFFLVYPTSPTYLRLFKK